MKTNIDWNELKVTDKADLVKVLIELANCIDNFSAVVVELTGAEIPLKIELTSLKFALYTSDFARVKEVGKLLVAEYERLMGDESEVVLPWNFNN
jgi:predicted ATPase